MTRPNLKKLINDFVECGEEMMKLEKMYEHKVSGDITSRYAKVFKALVEESAEQIKIN